MYSTNSITTMATNNPINFRFKLAQSNLKVAGQRRGKTTAMIPTVT